MKTIAIWSLTSRSVINTNLPVEQLLSLAMSWDGHWLAAGSVSGQVKVWNLVTNSAPVELPRSGSWVLALAFSPDGKVLATGDSSQQIRLWEPGSTNCLRALQGHRGEVWWLHYSADGQWLYSGSSDRTVRRWSTAVVSVGPRLFQLAKEHCLVNLTCGGAQAQVFDQQNLVFEEWDLVRSNRLRQVKLQATQLGHPWRYPPRLQGNLIVTTGAAHGCPGVFDIATGMMLFPDPTQTNFFLPSGISPDGGRLAGTEWTNGGWLGGVWELKGRKRLLTVPDQNRDLISGGNAVFSPDGKLLAYEDRLHQIALYDLSASRTRFLPGHSRPLYALRFSHDGRWLASASWDATACVWEVATGSPVTSWLIGHQAGIDSLEFSPDGRTLITENSSDETFRFWHLPTGSEVLGHRSKQAFLAHAVDSEGTTFMEVAPGLTNTVSLTLLPPLSEIDTQTKSRALIRIAL